MKRNKLVSFHLRLYLFKCLVFIHLQSHLNERRKNKLPLNQFVRWIIHWNISSEMRLKKYMESIWDFSFAKNATDSKTNNTSNKFSEKCVDTHSQFVNGFELQQIKYSHMHELTQQNEIILFWGQTHHSLTISVWMCIVHFRAGQITHFQTNRKHWERESDAKKGVINHEMQFSR